MIGIRKRLLAGAVASLLTAAMPPMVAAQAEDREARLETLFAELAEPGREDWSRIEGEITRLWSQSGSPAMDLLLRRGAEAMEAEDYAAAIEHLTALTDHAPDFAEGWNARATAFFLLGEYALSLADIERTLALNPQHFGALGGLAAIFEQSGRPDLALAALRAVGEITPNRPDVAETIERLERAAGVSDL
jgi:tetratricopeptide (TPR) repeat protein